MVITSWTRTYSPYVITVKLGIQETLLLINSGWSYIGTEISTATTTVLLMRHSRKVIPTTE